MAPEQIIAPNNMKHHLLLSSLAISAFTMQAQITETATQAVSNMGPGWNLGNTLDANSHTGATVTDASYWGQQGLESETCWGQPTTTKALITMMKNAGFGAVRVPVTWYNHMDKDGKVDAAWMKRVHEVVDYVIDNDLYCIINVHHDTGQDGSDYAMWIHADEDNYSTHKERYEYLWRQIAEEFRDYGEKLLFAGYNEMLDRLNSWCYASFSASGQYDSSVATSAYNGINAYAKSFVETVRATGGNNATRNLVVNTYASANGSGSWKSYLQDPLKQLVLPESSGHLLVEVHAYPALVSNGSDRTFLAVKADVDDIIQQAQTYLVSKGAPVIFGEWGTSNVDATETDYDARRSLMFSFVDYFVAQTKLNGMGAFYWMGLSDGQYRSIPAFSQPDLAERIAKAYHGSSFVGEYPEMEPSQTVDVLTESKSLSWGNGFSIDKLLFKQVGENVRLELTYTFSGSDDDIQFFYADWSSKPDFNIGSVTYGGDYQPHIDHKVGDTCTTTISFGSDVYAELVKRGLFIHGNGVTVLKAVLSDASAAAIQDLVQTPVPAFAPVFSLSGHRVINASSGFFLRQGRKVLVR